MSDDSMMALAIEQAKLFIGATSPNPPVGAVITNPQGDVLAVGAHERAGLAHAEINAIKQAEEKGLLSQAHTLYVTLEPCNHFGKTPPCTDAILKTPIKRVIVGMKDPNSQVKGGGLDKLKHVGLEVNWGVLEKECRQLTEGFISFVTRNRPFFTIKQAFNENGSMIPEPGQKTFTSKESLIFAHQLRKESDAILTGSGTILADEPLFTVRHVPDHPLKTRPLIILDRRGRVPQTYLQQAGERNLKPIVVKSLEETINHLVYEKCLKVLVEAGPSLSESFLKTNLWDRHIEIFKSSPDRIVIQDRLV